MDRIRLLKRIVRIHGISQPIGRISGLDFQSAGVQSQRQQADREAKGRQLLAAYASSRICSHTLLRVHGKSPKGGITADLQ
jgi:hypothetical protein